MKPQFKLGSILLLVMALVFSGCSKDEGSNSAKDYEKFSFTSEEVLNKIPDGLKNSSDQYAEECYAAISTALDMSAFMDNMTPPEDARIVSMKSTTDEVVYTWTWTYGEQTITIFWTYRDDATKNYWTMQIQFDGGTMYEYIDAWEMKDGSRGEVQYNFNWICGYDEMYYDECYDYYWTYTWEKTASGGYHFSFYWDSDYEEYSYYLNYDIIINADGSGSVDYYLNDALFYHMEWDALGNGSWTYYYGGYTESGSWTV